MLSKKQLEQIYSLIDFHVLNVAWKTFGVSVLDEKQKNFLLKNGVDITKIKRHIPPYFQNWMFGLLTAKLRDYQAKKITYKDFLSYLDRKQYSEPSKREIEEYEIARNRSYSYLKGLGEKVKDSVVSTIENEMLQSSLTRQEVISEEIQRGILERKSVKRISSEIANRLNEWNRDWERIVQTEYQSVFNMGRLQTFMKEGKGYEQKIYFDVYNGACRHCIRLYLTGGIGSQPRIFTAKELIANGTNIGRNSKDWKATILMPIHPFCRCTANEYEDGLVWDTESKMFKEDPEYQRKTRPDVKVKVQVGDLNFIV